MCFTRGHLRCAFATMTLGAVLSLPAFGQTPGGSERGAVAVSSGIDLADQYMFRGIRQNATGVVMWPSVDVELVAYSGHAALDKIAVNVGFWNSLHTGDTGSGGPAGALWYESDAYAGFTVVLNRMSLATAYTAYRSPNDMFDSVKEVSFKVALDDRGLLGQLALMPYVVTAFEVDTAIGMGQADGGLDAGRYLELGVAPRYPLGPASVSFPVKFGMSLRRYYELAGDDHSFGFASIASCVTVPFGKGGTPAKWHLRGGLEFQALGETTKAFNGGKASRLLGSIGVGFSY